MTSASDRGKSEATSQAGISLTSHLSRAEQNQLVTVYVENINYTFKGSKKIVAS